MMKMAVKMDGRLPLMLMMNWLNQAFALRGMFLMSKTGRSGVSVEACLTITSAIQWMKTWSTCFVRMDFIFLMQNISQTLRVS